MAPTQTLSQTSAGQSWLSQFVASDRTAAAAMLDAMLLLNEDQVITSIRMALDRIAKGGRYRNKRVALYVEREFQEAAVFKSQDVLDRNGRMRSRAVGRSGPAAVKPVRGRSRVGSEGLLAFVVSQQKEAWPKVFMNHPGPDSLRAKSAVGEIVILTDFIGSGSRVKSMLDKFWAVPTVRSWVSRKLIKFRVVAAATTAAGLTRVKSHRLMPEVTIEWIAPVVSWHSSPEDYLRWQNLIDNNGPEEGRGCGRYGFGGDAALIAFSYRIPNNSPALIHQSRDGWHALFDGPAPTELHGLFGVRAIAQVIDEAAADHGISIGSELTEEDRLTILVLSLLRGRWRKGSEVTLSSKTGLSVPALLDILRRALKNGLVTGDGRITDDGYAFLSAGKTPEAVKPIVASKQEPYYPEALRVPR